MNKPEASADRLSFAGLTFRGLRGINLLPQPGIFKFIVTVNADLIVTSFQSKRFANLISKNFATIDGQITMWLAHVFGKPKAAIFEKVSGSSFAYDLLQHAADNKLRVFFLGASNAANELATLRARERYGVDVIGYSPPLTSYPFPLIWNEEVLSHIKQFSPHILLVALGSPKQEYWIEENTQILIDSGVQVAIGCGGTLDFIAGTIPRAPLTIQRIGLEGLFRLAMQPSWFRVRRITRSLLVFPIVIWRHFHSKHPEI